MFSVFDGGLSIQEYEPSSADLTATPLMASGIGANLRTEFIRGEGMGGGAGGMIYSIKEDANGNDEIICSHANHRGDVIARSDSTESLTSFALYEAYEKRPYEWGDDPDRQKANTKEEESDLGLLNEGMRFRDLETGVFLTRDPIGYGDGPNVYCYVHYNPIMSFDPLGLADILWKKAENVTQEELEAAQEELEAAQENYERQKTYRNADGSKPESVKRMEWLESSPNKHDVTIKLRRDYTYGNCAQAEDERGAKDPEKGSTSYVIIVLNSVGKSYGAEKNVKRDLGATFAHEVAGHAYNNAKGESLIGADKNDPDQLKKEEQSATYIENTHRAARHLIQRTTYSGLWKVKQAPKQRGPIIKKPSQSDLSKRDEA